MSTISNELLYDQINDAIVAVSENCRGWTRDQSAAMEAFLVGGSIAAQIAVRQIEGLRELLGPQGDVAKTTRLLKTFALQVQSFWMTSEEADQADRQQWIRALLNAFGDSDEGSADKFINRDIQHLHEIVLQQQAKPVLVGAVLLLSDVHGALAGPTVREPHSRFPYSSSQDLRDRGGVGDRLPSYLNDPVNVMVLQSAVGSGVKACIEHYDELSERSSEGGP